MPKYMLLLHHANPSEMASMTPAEMQAHVAEYGAWTKALAAAGKFSGGTKLTSEGGRIASVPGGRFYVTEGPYAEAKEVIGGIMTIEAADYDEAVSLVQDCPHLRNGNRIEIRQIDAM